MTCVLAYVYLSETFVLGAHWKRLETLPMSSHHVCFSWGKYMYCNIWLQNNDALYKLWETVAIRPY